MGSGASATALERVPDEVAKASVEELAAVFADVSQYARDKLVQSLQEPESGADATGSAAISSKIASNPSAADDIPEDWGWPKKPFEPEDLKEHVYNTTQLTHQEKWDESLEARAIDSKREDFVEEKAFANLLLNKEGTGEEKKVWSIDPNAYKKGKWYRFLNYKGDCYVYVHNYTRDITASRPENFTDLTDEEKRRLKKLGTYIKELPRELERIYKNNKAIPIVYGSTETCDALKTFFTYDKYHHLLDCAPLKRVNPKVLEDSRKAIVNAMKYGKCLALCIADVIPEFEEKICISKNRDSFPRAVFRHGGLENDIVKEKIFREEDKESGMCMVRDGFRVCIVLPYDSMNFEHSSMRKEALPRAIPDFEYMEEVKVYNDDDKIKILEAFHSGRDIASK